MVPVETQGWTQAADRHRCSNISGDDLRYELDYSQRTADRHRTGTRQAPNEHTFLRCFVVGFTGLHNAPVSDSHQLEERLVRQADKWRHTKMGKVNMRTTLSKERIFGKPFIQGVWGTAL